MRIERVLPAFIALSGLLVLLISTSANAQIDVTIPYHSNEQIEVATGAAQDSLDGDVLLVGIATAGEIDLGGFGVYKGFDLNDGTSNAWGYQFLTPSGEEGIALGVVQFIVGPPYIDGERGNDFDLEVKPLDLTGAYANSDAFIARLKTNTTFDEYLDDYPDAVPEGVVLTWRPEGQDFLPEEFPIDKPIWGIYFNTNAPTPDDSTMACFVASGTGETHCVRADVSAVEDDAVESGSVRLTVAPNPVGESGTATLSIGLADGKQPVSEVGLYDIIGRKVLDLTGGTIPDGANGLKIELGIKDLPAGTYICRVVQGSTIRSIRVIVE